MSQNLYYFIFYFYLCNKITNMEENNNIIESVIGNDEYTKYAKEINKVILDKLIESVCVPKEYERGFDYAWMSKQS